MAENHPTVYRLPIHNENMQQVYYEEGDEIVALERNRITMLTAFFETNLQESLYPPSQIERTDTQNVVHPLAKDLLYDEFPTHFVWTGTRENKRWQRRVYHPKEDVIGRVNFVPFNAGESYYIRVLLQHVRGPTNFEDLRTVDGIVYSTYREACGVRGLLIDDTEWRNLFSEMDATHTPLSMRETFISILLFETPTNPFALWEEFKDSFCYDFTRERNNRERLNRQPIIRTCNDEDYNEALHYIDFMLDEITNGNKNLTTFGLPPLNAALPIHQQLSLEDNNFDRDALWRDVEASIESFNDEQRLFFDQVMQSISNREGRMFFLDGPGGTGKTFVFNSILKLMKLLDITAIASASSGIAGNILINGRTHHNAYGVPFLCYEDSQCNISSRSRQGQRIIVSELLLFDEAPMTNKDVIHSINRLVQDLTSDNRPFGGKTVVFGGDWRQVLPVIQHGSHAQILQKVLTTSPLWPLVENFHLVRNERFLRAGGNPQFANYVMQVGSGSLPTYDHLLQRNGDEDSKTIKLPEEIVFDSQDPQQLLQWTFPNLLHHHIHRSKACILTTKNVYVDALNNKALELRPGPALHKLSADSTDDTINFIPTEFLNSLTPSGCPPHDLQLKVGCPVILLRNLNPKRGLCNGTRMVVTHIGKPKTLFYDVKLTQTYRLSLH